MNKIKAILVDDEESARDVLENLLLRFCPEVEVVEKCAHVPQAVEAIRTHAPDVVFLDIEMPNYAGYEIVKFFEEIPFEIVFVTAYDQYAVRAFEVAAIDYLLKPVEIDRLKSAVSRVAQRVQAGQAERMALLGKTLESKEVKNILLSDKGMQFVVPLDQIIAIEAEGSYCTITTTTKTFIASKNLAQFERILEGLSQFFRVHKSFIINLQHMEKYSRTDLSIKMKNGLTTKLSKYRLAEFETAVKLR